MTPPSSSSTLTLQPLGTIVALLLLLLLLPLTTTAAGVDLNALCPAADTGKSKCIPNQPNQYVICAGPNSSIQTTNIGISCQNGIPVYAGGSPAPAGVSPPPPPPPPPASSSPPPPASTSSTVKPSPSSTSTAAGNAVSGYPSTMGPYHSTDTGRKASCKGRRDFSGTFLQYVCIAGTDLEVIRCDSRAPNRDFAVWKLPDYYACNKKKNQVLDRKSQKPVHEFDSYPGSVGYQNSGPNL